MDHCVSTQDGHSISKKLEVRYDLSFRDHIPLVVELGLDKLPEVEEETNNVAPKIDWDKCDAVKLREYSLMTDLYLSRVPIPTEALKCRNTKCNDKTHIEKVSQFYNNICSCLTDASNAVIGTRVSKPYTCRPGFNEHVKELHDIARKRFIAWKDANKPRDANNDFFKEMTVSRARFKLALRYIKNMKIN